MIIYCQSRCLQERHAHKEFHSSSRGRILPKNWQKPTILLLLCTALLLHPVESGSRSSSTSNGKFPLSPVSNWQESWTASQAQSTAMAMVVQDCVVILLRSPPSSVYKQALPIDKKQNFSIHGLKVQKIQFKPGDSSSSSSPMVQYAPSWIPVGDHSLCAMTGLAMDVEHLTRVLQKFVDNEQIIFDRSSTTFSMMQMLARILQDVCLRKESRPYGVQAMLIGCDDIDPQHKSGLCMYTMDPSGTWQSWGKATAIGRYGREIRRFLGKKLWSLPAASLSEMDIPQAIDHLMDCWKQVCKQQGVNPSDEDDWELLLLQRDVQQNMPRRCLYTVPKTEIGKILEDSSKEEA